MENQYLAVSIISAEGNLSLKLIEASRGPCTGIRNGAAVTLSARNNTGHSNRYFNVPNDLAKALTGCARTIAPGLVVGLCTIDRQSLRAEGPGAQFWQATQDIRGLRNRAPDLSAGWLAVIRASVNGG